MDSLKIQHGGDHYKQFVIEPAEYIIKNNIPFAEGNVIKYISRHAFKNGLEDLKKAKHYIDMIIDCHYSEELKNEQNSS